MNSSPRFSHRKGFVLASSILMLLALLAMPVQSVKAQEEEDPDEVALDGSCRSASQLSVIPGVLSSGFYRVLADGTAEVVLTLNPNHRMDQVAPYACNKDKFRWVINKSFNVCFSDQPVRGGFRVFPCTPGINMLFWVKAKFSENFNINGGITLPRTKEIPIVIEVNQQFGTIPDGL